MSSTTKRPPRALYVTRAALERAPAEDVLKAFALLGDEVIRRIENYAENAVTAASLLDGIQFAGAATAIQGDFTHGRYPYSLFHAVNTLTRILSEAAWEERELEVDDA